MIAKQKKSKIVYNAFEQAAELGKDTARQAVKEIAKTFNPLSATFENPTKSERQKGNNNFTEVDFNKLQNQYNKQDSPQLDTVRNQLETSSQEQKNPKQLEYDFHKRVKHEEEEYLAQKEQEEEEKKRQEALREEEKKLQEEEENKQPLETPKGKVRKSIFGGKKNRKSTTELPPEIKPGAGKQ